MTAIPAQANISTATATLPIISPPRERHFMLKDWRQHLLLIPFDILVLIFVSQSMLPIWAALLLALVNFGTWWCYYRIPYFLRTVSGAQADHILIPGPIVEDFARFINSCGIHHRAHYGLMFAMMAGFHAMMSGSLFNLTMSSGQAMLLAWSCYAAMIAIDAFMFTVSFKTLRELKKDSLKHGNVYTAELKRSNDDLEQFAYIASHDLRAPLRSMQNLTSWIAEDLQSGETENVGKNVSLLQGRISRLDRLLNDLLQYSRVGQEGTATEDFSVTEKVETVFDTVTGSESARLTVTGPDVWVNDFNVTYDILLSNLIGNALKHNDKHVAEIHVSVSPNAGGLELTIEDNGPGIDPQYHEKIFNIFSTLQARDAVEASGMGLAIVKKIVDLKNGTIAISDSELGGCKFSIWLNCPTFIGQAAAAE